MRIVVVVAAKVVIVYSVCPHSYYCFCCCFSLLLAPILALLRTLAAARAAQSYIVRLRRPQPQRCFVIFQTSSPSSFALPPASHWFLCMCLCAVPTIISIHSRLHNFIGQSRMRLNNFLIPIDFQRVSVLHSFLHTFLSPAPPTCLSLLFAFLFIVFHALFYVSTLTRDCVCVRAFVCACKLCKRCIDFEFQCE